MENEIFNKGKKSYKILIIAGIALILLVFAVIFYSYNGKTIENQDNQTAENPSLNPLTENAPANASDTQLENASEIVVEAGPQTYVVEIIKFKPTPESLAIKAGDSVVWINRDKVPHRLMSETGREILGKAFYENQNWTHTFESTGIYDYYCTVYPYVKGVVSVE
jgi:plastocyanin